MLASRWREHDLLDPDSRAAVDATRVVPVDETRDMLIRAIRDGWDRFCDTDPNQYIPSTSPQRAAGPRRPLAPHAPPAAPPP
jgi:hypothetical protein